MAGSFRRLLRNLRRISEGKPDYMSLRTELEAAIEEASRAQHDSTLWWDTFGRYRVIDGLLDDLVRIFEARTQLVIDASRDAIDDLKAEIADLKDQMKEMRHEACDREREMQRELRDALAEARWHEENG